MKSLSFISKYLILISIVTLFSSNLMAQSQYILMRHAEKQKDVGRDPKLTCAGLERAKRIAQLLENTQIDTIYSTDYHRTRMTVEPLAKLKQIEIKIYDPRKLEEFAELLKSQEGNFVIAGHSNTTPQLTSILAEKEIAPMDESQYSDIYLVNRFEQNANVIKLSTDKAQP